MPTELVNLAETAREFLQRSGYSFIRLEKAEQEESNDRWRLTFDVGLTKQLLKTVIIEGGTGKVVGLE